MNSDDRYRRALDTAHRHALRWLETLPDRPIAPAMDIDAMLERLDPVLPENGTDPATVIDALATQAEPGLMAMGSPRYYGFVIGGTYPSALAADWLVAAWDQNTGSRQPTPATAAFEETAARWLVDLLRLPEGSGVGFATGATSANLACLVTARDAVLRAAGHDPVAGLGAAPRVRFFAGDAVHTSVALAGRIAGLGVPETVGADREGRIDLAGLERALSQSAGPAVVALQAGDVHSGAFDAFGPAIDIAHAAGAWVHVDGAFGLWARAVPRLNALTDGIERADSWATDAHKTLNVPYDCGLAVVKDESAMVSSLGVHAEYLPQAAAVSDPHSRVAELSRRARGVPVWAALRELGRTGVTELVDRLGSSAAALAEGFASIPGLTVLNEVVFTQVCVAAADDRSTAALGEWLRAEGTVWASSSRWQGRTVVRFSVSNHGTGPDAVARTIDAVRRGASAVGAADGEVR